MAVLPIIEIPDPRLRKVSEPVTAFDADLRRLVADMFETMYDAPGIGLAAIQVGEPKRVLVIDLQDDGPDGERIKDPRVFINPVLSEPTDDTSIYNEGCLSVPDQYADVSRPVAIRAQWLDENGEAHDERIEGMLATCLQHEMDHLEGVLFIDRLSRLKRDLILRRIRKLQKNGEW